MAERRYKALAQIDAGDGLRLPGQVVELDAGDAEALLAAGHIEPCKSKPAAGAGDAPAKPKPKRKSRAKAKPKAEGQAEA